MKSAPYEVMQSVQDLVYRSCEAMNSEAWQDYLGLCDPQQFRYKVVTYTPEIRREQNWADRDFKAMKQAFTLLPKHNSDHAKLTRHANVQSVKYDPERQEAHVSSTLTIYRTQVDGTMSYLESGQTNLYAVGSYHDQIRLVDGNAVLVERTVRLDTRQLDVGSHKPF